MKQETSLRRQPRALGPFLYLAAIVCIVFHPALLLGQSQQGEGMPVVVEEVIQKQVRSIVSLIGTAEPHRRSVVAPEVEGLVVDFPVRKGQKVAKGALLVRIQPRPLLLQLKAARANLAEATENHKNALSELRRITKLYEGKSVSSKAYDDARHQANALQDKITALDARIETIQYELSKCVIRAPFAGFIVEEHTQLGQWLKKGGEVVTLSEIDPIVVTIPVPDRYIHALTQGQTVKLEFDFLPHNPVRTGTIGHIVPSGNEKARTFPVRILVANNDFSILPGMSAKVSFPVGKPYEAFLVDKDAVVTSGSGHHLFVVNDGKADLRAVKKGQAYGSLVAVEGRLSAGDKVVVEGNERLRPGQPVETSLRKR